MKENLTIVPVTLSEPNLKSQSASTTGKDMPACYFKIKDTEVTFYNEEIRVYFR